MARDETLSGGSQSGGYKLPAPSSATVVMGLRVSGFKKGNLAKPISGLPATNQVAGPQGRMVNALL